MSRYRQGGFHPVSLGDTFKAGRYKVYHKLGWGGLSTVWLARDQSYVGLAPHPYYSMLMLYISPRLQRWVSLKIKTAEGTQLSRELLVHQKPSKALASPHHLVQLLDSFIHQGPNRNHKCLVFELLGPTLDTIVAEYNGAGLRLDNTTVLRIARQLLQSLAAIHRAGYTHKGLPLSRFPSK
jgi:serine/threonine protein kinase